MTLTPGAPFLGLTGVTTSCDNHTGTSLFCSTCGRLREPGSLRSVKIQGFVGVHSTNPKMETFWETGDPAVFDQPSGGSS